MKYANIIVDLSADALDRLFTYTIPDGMHIEPGYQVSVPFGNRRMEGFVVSLSDTCALPPEKIHGVRTPALRKYAKELKKQEDFIIVDTGDPVKYPYDAVIMAEDFIELDDGVV